jgi:hypothetical protein
MFSPKQRVRHHAPTHTADVLGELRLVELASIAGAGCHFEGTERIV